MTYFQKDSQVIVRKQLNNFYYLNERFIINKCDNSTIYEKFDSYSRLTNQLYNLVTNIEREYYLQNNNLLDYNTLKAMNIDALKQLPNSIALSALYDVSDKWFRFKYKSTKMPRTRKGRNKRYSFTINPNAIKLIENPDKNSKFEYLIILPDNMGNIPTNIRSNSSIVEIRVSPNRSIFNVDIRYKIYKSINDKRSYDYNSNRIAGIDFGIENLIAVANNVAAAPLIINGRKLAAINKYYNKLLKKCKYNSNRFIRLNKRRINIINNFFNKTAKLLIDYLDLLQIKTLVIGLDYSNIFKNNDITYPIDFEYLYNRINLLCKNNNIELVSVDEYDTSYGSIFNYDHSDRNHNRRITDRLYMTDMIGIINCDVNSAINIMLKYKSNALDNMFKSLDIDSSRYHARYKKILSYFNNNSNTFIINMRKYYYNKGKNVNAAAFTAEQVKLMGKVLAPMVIKDIDTMEIDINKFNKAIKRDCYISTPIINKRLYDSIDRLKNYDNLDFLDKYQRYH